MGAMRRLLNNAATRAEVATLLQGLLADLPGDFRVPLELGANAVASNRDGEGRGGQADQEHRPPGAADRSRFLQLAQRDAHQSRQHIAERGEGL